MTLLNSPAAPYDWREQLFAYEDGALDHDEVIELFQHLVNNGLVWQLQGRYGRTARDLLESGEVSPPLKGA